LTDFTSVEVALSKLHTKEELNLLNSFYSCSQKSGAKRINRKILKERILKEMTCRIIDDVLEN